MRLCVLLLLASGRSVDTFKAERFLNHAVRVQSQQSRASPMAAVASASVLWLDEVWYWLFNDCKRYTATPKTRALFPSLSPHSQNLPLVLVKLYVPFVELFRVASFRCSGSMFHV